MKSLTTATIDLGALRDNYRAFKSLVSDSTEIMGVVKADAYGHGAVEVGKIAIENGCNSLAVARISEAVVLKEHNITAPVLLFGYCNPTYVDYMVNNNVIASVGSYESAEILNNEAVRIGKRLKVHLKIDTGMGRIGGCNGLESISKEIMKCATLSNLEIEGIYTHFANADAKEKNHANAQFSLFTDILDKIKKAGLEVQFRHAANSAAAIDMPETHLDLIRPGIAQYGLYPSKDVNKNNITLKPVLTLNSTVIQIKDVPAGFKVSYGSTYQTTKDSKIAVIPIGYADGYSRLLSSKGAMLINGQEAPILGRICMDLTMVDITNIPNVKNGTEVTVIGKNGDSTISADMIADLTGTINYEVVSCLTQRVQREYFK